MPDQEQMLIKQNKLYLGPITLFDCSGVDTANAHRMLGIDARAQIHKILAKRMNDLGSRQQVIEQIRQARSVQTTLNSKLQGFELDEAIKEAIQQYQNCLSAWGEGANLAEFHHPFLSESVDGSAICAGDLAILLQADEVGCQTGVYREHNGAVILWHSEEDHEDSPNQRFDRLRIFNFKAANGHTASGFIYPDLLPGPTFGWHTGEFMQAIDTLHVKPNQFENAILPNILAWLSLYLGILVSRQNLASQLGPFHGGYSLTAVYKKNDQVNVEKVEFANDKVAASVLDSIPGNYLFQTNILYDLSQPIGAEEQTSPESRAWNEKRLARTAGFMQKIQKSKNALAKIFDMLRSRLGGEAAYANRDVKAYMICRMTEEKTFIWVGPGAAERNDKLFNLEY